MKTIALFGAGQMGSAISALIGPDYIPICIADNFRDKWGQTLNTIPIVSPAEAAELKPDIFCLCVSDDERAHQMRGQLIALGYKGEIITPAALKLFDSRFAVMRLLASQINDNSLVGAVAELGVYKGAFAAEINRAFPHRKLHLFDTFEGFRADDVLPEAEMGYSKAKEGDFSDTSQAYVASRLPYPQNAVFHKGFFPETFKGCENEHFVFVSLDADLYAPTAAALPIFWDRLVTGGAILVHDVYSAQFRGVKKAVEAFCRPKGIFPAPVADLHGSAVLMKQAT